MNEKAIRIIDTIFTLDKTIRSTGVTTWNIDKLDEFVQEQEKHYGLKLISTKEEIFITIEYINIIWHYKIYYGSYKKKYKPLTKNDGRWNQIEKRISTDLKTIGLEELKDEVLTNLKNNKYYEYNGKKEEQFKKYCV